MKNSLKSDVVNSLVSIAYFWMGEDNSQCALSICRLLYELDLSTVQLKKVDDLYSDWKSMYSLKTPEKTIPKIVIPPEFAQTEDGKFLWVFTNTIINLFASGNFELAYANLMDVSINWEDSYTFVVMNLRKTEYWEEIYNWLMAHFFMAVDLLPDDEIKFAGYKISIEHIGEDEED